MKSRRAIEREMERFKVLERESKTKAYSKEGLAKLNKQKKADPRMATYEWIESMQSQLDEQIAELEEETDSVSATKGKVHTLFQAQIV